MKNQSYSSNLKENSYQRGEFNQMNHPPLGRLRQEDSELQVNLVYMVRPYLKKQKQPSTGSWRLKF
jgi:hypothetical protein